MTTGYSRPASIAAWLLRWGRKHWPDNLFVGIFVLLLLVEIDVSVRLQGYFKYLLASHLPIALIGVLASFYILFLRIRLERGAALTRYQMRLALPSGYWLFGWGFAFVGLGFFQLFTSPLDFVALMAPYVIAFLISGLLWLTDKIQRRSLGRRGDIGSDSAMHVSSSTASHLGWGRHSWSTALMVVLLVALVVGSSAWFVKSLPSLMPIYTFTQHTNFITALAWSPDNRRVASGDQLGVLHIWGAFDGSDDVVIHLPSRVDAPDESTPARSLAWSPDGADIAVCPDSASSSIWNATNGTRVATLGGPDAYCEAIIWAPDGKHVVTAAEGSGIQLWDLSNQAHPITLATNNDYNTSFAWASDGTRLAVATSEMTEVIDVSTRKTLWTTPNASPDVPLAQALAWFKGTSQIAFATSYLGDHGGDDFYNYVVVRTLNADTGTVLADTQKTVSGDNTLAWCAGCGGRDYLAVGQEDEPVSVWDASTLAELFSWHGQFGIVGAMAWSPNGRYIASGDFNDTVQVWRPSIGG